jgi:Ca2+-binding EF-hand superfamily protein
MFDLDRDGAISRDDLLNYYSIIFKEIKKDNIEVLKRTIVDSVFREFSGESDADFKIDKNNFQKIAWASNFFGNITFEP